MKRLFVLLSVVVCSGVPVLADESSVETALINTMDVARADIVKKEAGLNRLPELPKKLTETTTPLKKVSDLLDEIEALKAQVVVAKQEALNTEQPEEHAAVGAITVYPYVEGKVYAIHCGVGRFTDLELEPGETLSGPPRAADTVRWKVDLATSGSGANERQHIFVKPVEKDIETNLFIGTNRRSYHLTLRAADWHIPAVRWEYPVNPMEMTGRVLRPKKETKHCDLSIEGSRKNYHYRIEEESAVRWKPVVVFDDGSRTYIEMPKNLLSAEAPGLWVIGEDDEPQLVNYRLRCGHYIVDRLFEHGQLRIGKEQVVNLYSSDYQPGLLERIFG